MGSEHYVEGNQSSSSVVCTLWTLAHPLSQKFDPSQFAICANLYSYDGINTIVRAIGQHPHWRNLILAGADLTHGGDIIVSFFTNGIDENGKVNGHAFTFQPEIPYSFLQSLRENVVLIDMRGKPLDELATKLKSLEQKPAFANPQVFPEPTPKEFTTLQSEKTGFIIRGKTVSHAWLQIVDLIMKFGEEKPTEYGNKMKELIDIQAIIEGDDEIFPECVPFSKKDLEEYIPKLTSHEKPENVVYTYGSRLREGFDQVQHAIEYLKKTPHTRRAIAFTWRIREDPQNKNPPCLTQIVWNITNGKLIQTCTFRSHDMFEGWPLNVLGLREMQRQIAKEVGVGMGSLVCLSVSAHIYDGKWDESKKVLAKYYSPSNYRFDPDPRGNFVIQVDQVSKKVTIQHFTPLGEKTQLVWENTHTDEKKALEELFTKLAHSNIISRTDHALYMGAELQKVMLAMKQGKEYKQDKSLE